MPSTSRCMPSFKHFFACFLNLLDNGTVVQPVLGGLGDIYLPPASFTALLGIFIHQLGSGEIGYRYSPDWNPSTIQMAEQASWATSAI